ncbi:MAG: Sister chromatid cohesion protein 2 [Piccolia ochrophora]|nr:MAG: Sister chromatid cohesion protein 2 [Piccolia ochrophora]
MDPYAQGTRSSHPSRPSNGPSQQRVRPLTVDEALQYSPLSSIVPFGPDPIPLPTVGCQGTTSIFLTPEDRKTSRRTLRELDHEMSRQGPSSYLIQKAMQDIQSLLDPEELTKFRFKAQDVGSELPFGTASTITDGARASQSTMSPFSEMLLQSTDVNYRYPTPVTPGSRSEKNQSHLTRSPATPINSKLGHNDKAFAYNQDQSRMYNGMPTPEHYTPQPAIIVPTLPKSVDRSDYESFPDLVDRGQFNAASGLSRKRSPKGVGNDDEPLMRSYDQREKAEASLRALQELLADIFTSEDQLQPDTSGAVSDSAAKYFISTVLSEGEIPTLAPTVQGKLDAAIEKVISSGKFRDISVEELVRVQKLCEGALKTAEAVDAKLDNGWNEAEAESWLQQLDVLDAGLKSGRTLLRIMSGGREDKQLYPEELLRSALAVLKVALDSCVVPVTELRNVGSGAESFKALSPHKKFITSFFTRATKFLRLVSDLIAKEEVTESAITTVEYLAAELIFVENGVNDKESLLGVQKFENVRVAAMDVLVKIFQRHADQRRFIFDEILTSLEKLPVTRQKARQFKLIEGGSIQLVSGLILRLVQTSSMWTVNNDTAGKKGLRGQTDADGDRASEVSGDEEVDIVTVSRKDKDKIDSEAAAERYAEGARRELSETFQPLLNSAQRNAHYVIQFLVSRALKSTKTGDDPYRLLLDIFTEDFITVSTSTDWPAAELLLRSLLSSMLNIVESEKSSAPAKNMALDLLALMGAAISDMVTRIRGASRSIENGETQLDTNLAQLSDNVLEGTLRDENLLVWDGPYRAALEYLLSRDLNDGQIQSACGYYTVQWAQKVFAASEPLQDDNEEREVEAEWSRMAFRLRNMISDPKWLETTYDFETVTTAQGRLAYALTMVNMPFGKAFERILLLLLNSIKSEQATVRSKSLKSVIQLIEKDPTILDRGVNVIADILKRTSDPSPLVRDSAIGLIGKCITLKPALEAEVWETILRRVTDAQVGVRKRCMKISKDIYLRTSKKEIKSAIAEAFLHRVKDVDEGVSELARQMLEEIWMTPFIRPSPEDEKLAPYRLALKDTIFLIVRTVQRGESVSVVLESLLKSLLSAQSKSAVANSRVCKVMVASMFDELLDGEEQTQNLQRQNTMQTLTVFAKAKPKLFTVEQVELLQPYVEHVSAHDNRQIYRSVIVIYRCVLPHLQSLKTDFFSAVQKSLLTSITMLFKWELTEVVSCLWTINAVLKNIEVLSKITISCIRQIHSATAANSKMDPKALARYLTIAGLFGKCCDFDNDLKRFQGAFPWWKGTSVPALMVEVFAPFSSPERQPNVRSAALDALCSVCQSWPKQFLKEQVLSAFDIVFAESNAQLENLVLEGLKGFLSIEEKRSERGTDLDGAEDEEAGRLGRTFTINQNDGISSSLAQHFLRPITRISLATEDARALTAVEVMASVSRQGLVHPRACASAMVALETSQNPSIASIALREHRTLHQKHETIVEKEYARAIYQAFVYQRDVVKNASGATTQPFASKLRPLFDVIKTSKGTVRKKFLTNTCNRVDFDPAKLDVTDEVPSHVQFSRFLIENLAFFEYSTIDELSTTVSCMEKVVSGTGTTVAHAIETEIFANGMDMDDHQTEPMSSGTNPAVMSVDAQRLKQLTAASVILSSLWAARTHLRKLYGVNAVPKQRDNKNKDHMKAPTKVPFVTGDKFWDEIKKTMSALTDRDVMLSQCREFVELLTVDHELKVAAEEEDEIPLNMRMQTPSEDEGNGTPAPPGGSGKGRKRGLSSDIPGKRPKVKRRRSSGTKPKGSVVESGDEWL